jgi:hypothetical protein
MTEHRTTAATSSAAETREHPAESTEIFSDRLLVLLDDILAGQAPNAGRFCGYCYHPLAADRQVCPHCGRRVTEWPAVTAIPLTVIDMHRRRRGREGMIVRTFAWGGLTVGVILALLPLALFDVFWWSVGAFFGLLVLFYLLSANLANSLGDWLGYRWGQSLVRREWARFTASRADHSGESSARDT